MFLLGSDLQKYFSQLAQQPLLPATAIIAVLGFSLVVMVVQNQSGYPVHQHTH
jgi:hypothetical protein